MDNMLTAGEAAKILDMSPGGARNVLGDEHCFVTIPNGHKCRAWEESHVRRIKAERDASGVKIRERQETSHMKNGMPHDPKEYNPGKSFEFDVDKDGKVIERKKTFRGRVCRYQGCTVPVSTGKLYCDDHSGVYKAMQKNVATHGEAFIMRRI